MLLLTPELHLLPITPADHPRHLALMQRIYPPAFAYLWPDGGAWYLDHVHGKPAFLKDLAAVNTTYQHVYFRDELIGILRLESEKPCPDFPDRPASDFLKLDRLYLDDTVRGKGIGTTLIDYVKTEALRLDKSILWLERMDTNEATIGFYRKNGFVDGGTFRLPYENMYARFRGMYRMSWRADQPK